MQIEWMDFINGVFEAGIACFLFKGVLMLRTDKEVKGFYWPTVAWTTAWGIWNLAYYPHLGQWFSFSGGVAVVLVNITWLAHVAYYKRHRRNRNIYTARHLLPRLHAQSKNK